MASIRSILKEEKSWYKIQEKKEKDGTQGYKILYYIKSNEPLLDGKFYTSAMDAAMAILTFKNPITFGKKDIPTKHKEAKKYAEKILERMS